MFIDNAIGVAMIEWRKTDTDINYEVYNIGNEDWIVVDEVAEGIIKIIVLKIDKMKR
jgi:uncharacterized membrane protein YhfC